MTARRVTAHRVAARRVAAPGGEAPRPATRATTSAEVPAEMPAVAPGEVPGESRPGARPHGTPLQPEHALVLDALRAAILASREAAAVHDVIQALPKSHAAALRAAYANDLPTVVSKILGQLLVRGLVESPGRVGRQRYYRLPGMPTDAAPGTPSIGAPTPGIPDRPPSRRQRTLALVRATVDALGCAVLATEVVTHAEADPASWAELTAPLITRDLQNLLRTGAVVVSDTVRAESGKNLYLPNEPGYLALATVGGAPRTWLELVRAAAAAVWDGHVADAAARGAKPAPFTTAEVRGRLAATHPEHERLRDPRSVPNAMIQLAGGASPALRRLPAPGEAAPGCGSAPTGDLPARPTQRWAPASVPDDALGDEPVYASDAERLVAAVLRASSAAARAPEAAPRPVNADDVTAVVDADPSLRLAGTTSVAHGLSDLAKTHVDMGTAGHAERAVQRVWRVGRVGGRPLYAASHVAEARAFVALTNATSRWAALRPVEELDAAAGCPSRALANGRVRLLASELAALARAVDTLLGTGAPAGAAADTAGAPAPDRPTREDAERLAADVADARAQAEAWLAGSPTLTPNQGATPSAGQPLAGLPETVAIEVPSWSVEEYLAHVLPVYPRAAAASTRDEVIRLVQGAIRRVPNPDHVRRRDADARAAAELLFDRADALLDGARRWGGSLLRTRAAAVRPALGTLRDPAFAVAALREAGRDARLLGAAALAFLAPSDGSAAALREAAAGDRDPAVRQVACWALGFLAFTAGRTGDLAWVAGRASEDQDARVRHAVQDMLRTQQQAGPRGWWAV